MHASSRWAAYDGLVPAEALAKVTPETQTEVWRERMSLPESSAFVAERDGEVVGFVALLETEEGTELNAIHLLPDVVGTGVGSALMKAAVEHARARGAEALHLFVIEGNERARAFYTRTGWRLTGTAGTHEHRRRAGRDRALRAPPLRPEHARTRARSGVACGT